MEPNKPSSHRGTSGSNFCSPNAKIQSGKSSDAFADLVGPFSHSSTSISQKPLNSLPLKSQHQQQNSMFSMQPVQSGASYINPSNTLATQGGTGTSSSVPRIPNGSTSNSSSAPRLPNGSTVVSLSPHVLSNYTTKGLDGLDPFAPSASKSNEQEHQQFAPSMSTASGSLLDSFSSGKSLSTPIMSIPTSSAANTGTLIQSIPGRYVANTTSSNAFKVNNRDTQQVLGPGKKDDVDLLNLVNSNDDPFDIEFLSQKKSNLSEKFPSPAANDEFIDIFSQPTESKGVVQKSEKIDDTDILLQHDVEKLSAMGFDSQISRKALIDANMNLTKAIASLLNDSAPPPPAKISSFSTSGKSDQKIENLIQDLMKMGFDYGACRAALVSAGLDKQAAIAILVSDSATYPGTSSLSTNSKSQEMKKIKELMLAGFSEPDCRSALKMNGGNIESAMELLLSNPGPLLENEPKYNSITSTGSIVGAASQIGVSVFKNAKTAFTFAKKKVEEVLNEKNSVSVSEKEWAKTNFKESSDAIVHENGDLKSEGESSRGTVQPFSHQAHSLTRHHSDESIDVPLERRPRNTIYPNDLMNVATGYTANLLQLDNDDNLAEFHTAIHSPPSLSPKKVPVTGTSISPITMPLKSAVNIPSVVATDAQLLKSSKFRASGNEFFKQGQFGDAEADYTLGIDSLPEGHGDLIPLYKNRAACRLKNGNNRGAVADCDYILQKTPDDLKALLRRATAYEALECWEKARDDYRKIMGIDPNIKGCSIGLARTNSALHPKSEAFTTPANVPIVSKKVDIVKKAVEEAVQKVRESNEAKENLDNEKFKASESVEKKINFWKSNKESNIRALLSSLETVLWPECGWKSVNLGELITPAQVKKRYIQAVAKVHPDKLGHSCTVEQQLIASSVFTVLNKAWTHFCA